MQQIKLTLVDEECLIEIITRLIPIVKVIGIFHGVNISIEDIYKMIVLYLTKHEKGKHTPTFVQRIVDESEFKLITKTETVPVINGKIFVNDIETSVEDLNRVAELVSYEIIDARFPIMSLN